jgi:hypothetical protein
MAFKQLRYRVEQEREQQVSWLGEIESALESAFGRLPLTERGTGARLKQEGRDQPHLTGWARAVEDRRERGGRRPRVVLREPQRRHSGADTRSVAFLLGRLGQDGVGLCGLPPPHQDVQEEGVHLRHDRVRCDERPSGQALGGTQGV